METSSEAAEVPSCQGEQVVEKLLPLLLCPHKCILTITTTEGQKDGHVNHTHIHVIHIHTLIILQCPSYMYTTMHSQTNTTNKVEPLTYMYHTPKP